MTVTNATPATDQSASHYLNSDHRREQMLNKLGRSAIGIDTTYRLANGETRRRVYLDSTASCLQVGLIRDVMAQFLPHYANTHSEVHFGARITNAEYRWAHDMVLSFCGADPSSYGSFFVGSGVTAGLNRIAASMARGRPERDVVVTTTMEHHSNDLPHRKNFREVVHVPPTGSNVGTGCLDLDALEATLEQYGDRVNYVTVTGVSNVTGIINPIHDIAAIAHRHGTLVIVDGAQMAGHLPIKMSGHDDPAHDIDILVISGHKMYAPGSPGAVITRLELFQHLDPTEVGGGMVDDVHLDRSTTTARFPDREEAGTPNIVGAITLGAALYALKQIGMPWIFEEERVLLNYAVAQLDAIEGLIVYGSTDTDRYPRTGAVSINVRGLHHALTATILNDYFNIAVRNGCFCAHPYVRDIVSDDIMKQLDDGLEALTNEEMEAITEMYRGMVRASLGIYNSREDIDYLVTALRDVVERKDFYESQYEYLGNDQFRHRSFQFGSDTVYSTAGAVDAWFES